MKTVKKIGGAVVLSLFCAAVIYQVKIRTKGIVDDG